MGPCNLRVVTGLGLLYGCRAGTADRERKAQTTKARSRRPVRLGQARYWHSRTGETLTRYLSEGSGAVDKLGMVRCVVCQAGPFRIWRLCPLQAPSLNTDSCGPRRRRDRLWRAPCISSGVILRPSTAILSSSHHRYSTFVPADHFWHHVTPSHLLPNLLRTSPRQEC